MRLWTPTGAVLALTAVALGAAGSHAVPMDDHARQLFETASQYHFFHAIALVLTGLSIGHARTIVAQGAGMAFLLGSMLFCGSLYASAFGGPHGFGFLAPVGGTLLMLGWALLGIAVFLGRGHR
ncbi:DUF423 domain-containing protein [Iodidimonas sp. SYSU 1G8]|uniref:DUF423 domain-containing protein n=1 Tax=Iodidimonas sp. SYSU 1G8 TaxID=3133967 RepID=UPI0031FEA869